MPVFCTRGNHWQWDNEPFCWQHDPAGDFIYNSQYSPYNMKGWTIPPNTAGQAGHLLSLFAAAGRLLCVRLWVPTRATVNTLQMFMPTAGATLTADQNFMGIYSAKNGALLGQTADLSATWSGATGLLTIPLTTDVFLDSQGHYFVAMVWNGTTAPTFSSFGGVNGSLTNWGITAGLDSISVLANTGITTTLPSTLSNFTNTSSITIVGVR